MSVGEDEDMLKGENGGARKRRSSAKDVVLDKLGKKTASSSLQESEVSVHRGRPLLKTIHSNWRCSPMSMAAQGTSYNGFSILFTLVAVTMNIRLVVENLMKHGILLTLPSIVTTSAWDLGCYAIMCVFIARSWRMERQLPPQAPHTAAILRHHFFNIAMIFALPGVFVWVAQPEILHGVILLCFSICWTFKTISFVHVARDIRRAQAEGVSFLTAGNGRSMIPLVEQFPRCLGWKDMFSFILFPTMCFQLKYPRNDRVRKRVVCKQFILLVLSVTAIYVLVEQYVTPILEGARVYVAGRDIPASEIAAGLVERLLKLSIPSLYCWLLLFFSLFHVYLNLLAEVTRFADRKFYDDWWNARNFGEYWHKWNYPIHDFLTRHVYSPLLRIGYSRIQAQILVFLISGLLHEYLVAVPLHLPRPTMLIFLAFVFQIPLILMTTHPKSPIQHYPRCGNVLFWIAFCFTGQPIAVLMYFLFKTAPDVDLVAVLRR